jgi:hypothetical protein
VTNAGGLDLKDARLKVTRARQHFEELQRGLEEWQATDPVRFVSLSYLSDFSTCWFLDVRQPPPPELGAVVGDFLHNLRTALDQLAWQLFLACGGDPEGTAASHVYFPVVSEEKAWAKESRRKLPGVPGERLGALRAVQPFAVEPDRGTSWLYALHLMDLDDKHRQAQLSCALLQQSQLRQQVLTDAALGCDLEVWFDRQYPLTAGRHLVVRVERRDARDPSSLAPPEVARGLYVEFRGEPELGFAYSSGRAASDLAGLQDMADAVSRTVDSVEKSW